MKRLYLMVTIVTRHLGEKYLNFYLEHELEVQLVTLGRGTVNDAMLDSFGLESHEKAVLFSFVTREKWRELQKGMHKSCRLICRHRRCISASGGEHRRTRRVHVSDEKI